MQGPQVQDAENAIQLQSQASATLAPQCNTAAIVSELTEKKHAILDIQGLCWTSQLCCLSSPLLTDTIIRGPCAIGDSGTPHKRIITDRHLLVLKVISTLNPGLSGL